MKCEDCGCRLDSRLKMIDEIEELKNTIEEHEQANKARDKALRGVVERCDSVNDRDALFYELGTYERELYEI